MDDNASGGQELARLRRLKELEDRANGVPETTFMDFLKNTGTAAYKGLAGLAAGAGDALAGSHDITDIGSVAAGKPVREVDESMPVSRALEETGYQPKNQGERYWNAGIRGATSALIGPSALASPGKALLIGGLAGLGGEGAGQLPGVKGTSFEPYARVVGSLLGGTAGGLATSTVGNSGQLSNEMLRDSSPLALAKAKIVMAQAQKEGLPINLDQAMGKDSNITNVVQALVSRKEGQPVVDQLRQQIPKARTMAARVINSLPGEVKETSAISNDAQSAATAALAKARAARTAATEPIFAQAGNVAPDQLDTMLSNVKAEAAQYPDTNRGALLSGLGKILENAKNRSAGEASGLLDAQGTPIPAAPNPVPVQDLNGSFRSLLNQAKNINLSSSANDKEAIGGLQNKIGELRDIIGQTNPKFKQANDLYSAISENVVDPLKKSVVGRIAGTTGELADKEAVGKILPLLAKGRDPRASSSDILDFAQATSDNPDTFRNAVKTHFANAVARAEGQENGAQSASLPGNLEKELLGDAFKRQGMKDQLMAVGQGMGADDPSLLYKGFNHAMKIMSAAAKRPDSLGVSPGELEGIASQSTIAKGLKMIGLAPGKPAGQGLERLYSANAYKTLADNLTTPEGVTKLQELAKLPLLGPKATTLLSTLLATQSAPKPPEVKNITPGDSTTDEGEPK